MKRLFLAASLASGSVLPFACFSSSNHLDKTSAPVPEPSPAGHYILPAHGNMVFYPSISEDVPSIGTRTPLDSLYDFFENTSLSRPATQKLLDSQNLRWGVTDSPMIAFVSGSFMYGSPEESNDDPDPQGSYTRSDLMSVDAVSAILQDRRPAVEFYPVKGEFTTLTREDVKKQLPPCPVYIVPGDLVARATNTFPSGSSADVHTYNAFLVANVKRLNATRANTDLTALLGDAQELEPIGRYKPVTDGDRFRTYNLLTGQFGVLAHNDVGESQVYLVQFNGPKLLYPQGSDSSLGFMERILSERGVDGGAAYCGHDVSVRYLK